MPETTLLPILHFNDVYRVQPQKLPSSTKTVSASQFTQNLDNIRNSWQPSTDAPGAKDGLVLFSGDIFSPSLESGVTRGSHMVPVINMIGPDVALTGNHDFDFGYPHLTKLVQACNFPWLLSNIIDKDTGQTPAELHAYHILRRCGLTIGVIGLVEEDWIQTVSSWPPSFSFQPMDKVGIDLSQKLRAAPHNCDLIIALTHCRLPNDITLAAQLGAKRHTDPTQHGVDVLFGGHDHMYYVGRGIDDWEGWNSDRVILGGKEDQHAMLIKSGTDFRDLSELTLEVEDTPVGSVRKKVIKSVRGKKHVTAHDWPSCPKFDKMLKSVIGEVQSSLSKPVCETLTKWDVRSEHVRTEESAIGNWMADILKHAYDDAICIKGHQNGGADAVLICGGTLRGDSTYGPGPIALGDIYEILPFDDPIIMLELTGEDIWNALENGFSTWPAQEGRFPVVAGMRVKWDSRRPPYQRVVSIHMCEGLQLLEEVMRDASRTYTVVSKEYMARGFDGFDALKDKPYLINDESGVVMSSLIRKFLLGSQYIHTFKQEAQTDVQHLHPRTEEVLDAARKAHQSGPGSPEGLNPQHARGDIQDALHVSRHEHMSAVDCLDGQRTRAGGVNGVSHPDRQKLAGKQDLIAVAPTVDGRLVDIGRQ